MSDAHASGDERAVCPAAQRKAWNDAHPNYYADYRERNREHIRRKNRDRERQRTQRAREEKAQRQKGIDRAKAWAKEHPEERQQARQRYKQKHPDAYKQAQRDYYYRNCDAIAERGARVRLQTRRRQTRPAAALSTALAQPAGTRPGHPLQLIVRLTVSARTRRGVSRVAGHAPGSPSGSCTACTRPSDVTTKPQRTPSSRRSATVRMSSESGRRMSRLPRTGACPAGAF